MTMPHDTFTTPPTNQPVGNPSVEDTGTVSDVSTGTRAQIRDVRNQVVDHAKQSFRQARDSAGSSLSESRHLAADRIGGLASAVRGTSERLRSDHQDRVADLTDGLADHVERLSSYLRDHDLGDFRRDAESFARRQPAVAVGIALALGLIGARFLKSGKGAGGGHDRL
jgi:hypothetical protein